MRFREYGFALGVVAVAGCGTVAPTTTSVGLPVGEVTVSIKDGDGQTAVVGHAVQIPPTIHLFDGLGSPMKNYNVTFAVTSGGGTIDGPTQSTSNAGIAKPIAWTLGSTPGINTVTATIMATGLSNGVRNNPVTFRATAVAATSIQATR